MKKIFCFISVLIVILSLFSACSKNKSPENKKSDKMASSTTEKHTFDTDSDYELGEEAVTTVVENGDEKQVYHRDEYGDYIIMDHRDADGNIIYYEEPVYNSLGEVKGYKYYDADMKHFGSTDSANRFYDTDGNEISENEFTILLQKAPKAEKGKN